MQNRPRPAQSKKTQDLHAGYTRTSTAAIFSTRFGVTPAQVKAFMADLGESKASAVHRKNFDDLSGQVSEKILDLIHSAAQGSSSACKKLDQDHGITIESIDGEDFEVVQRCVIAIH